MSPIELYFRAEKLESLVFLALGVLTVALSGWLIWQHRTSLTIGLAIPLALVGLIQLAVGSTVYKRAEGQLTHLQRLHHEAPDQFAAEELPRLAAVNANFDTYKLIEIGFVLIGTGLIYFLQQRDFWLGLGLGMLLQGTAMLAADVFAERRADSYTAFVRQLAATT